MQTNTPGKGKKKGSPLGWGTQPENLAKVENFPGNLWKPASFPAKTCTPCNGGDTPLKRHGRRREGRPTGGPSAFRSTKLWWKIYFWSTLALLVKFLSSLLLLALTGKTEISFIAAWDDEFCPIPRFMTLLCTLHLPRSAPASRFFAFFLKMRPKSLQ